VAITSEYEALRESIERCARLIDYYRRSQRDVASIAVFNEILHRLLLRLEELMTIQPDADLLTTLRSNLRHFEQASDTELSADAAEIKRLLLHRIAVIEAAIEKVKKVVGQDTPTEP